MGVGAERLAMRKWKPTGHELIDSTSVKPTFVYSMAASELSFLSDLNIQSTRLYFAKGEGKSL